MKAKLLCAWCVAEGKEGFIGWTETTDGLSSHGICQEHFDKLAAEYGLDEESLERGHNGHLHTKLD